MSHFKDETFWVADDGSYGYGWLTTFDKANWSDEQHAWLDRYLDEHDEPDMDDIIDIDNNIEPEWDE